MKARKILLFDWELSDSQLQVGRHIFGASAIGASPSKFAPIMSNFFNLSIVFGFRCRHWEFFCTIKGIRNGFKTSLI